MAALQVVALAVLAVSVPAPAAAGAAAPRAFWPSARRGWCQAATRASSRCVSSPTSATATSGGSRSTCRRRRCRRRNSRSRFSPGAPPRQPWQKKQAEQMEKAQQGLGHRRALQLQQRPRLGLWLTAARRRLGAAVKALRRRQRQRKHKRKTPRGAVATAATCTRTLQRSRAHHRGGQRPAAAPPRGGVVAEPRRCRTRGSWGLRSLRGGDWPLGLVQAQARALLSAQWEKKSCQEPWVYLRLRVEPN